jgi:hypothetical protein
MEGKPSLDVDPTLALASVVAELKKLLLENAQGGAQVMPLENLPPRTDGAEGSPRQLDPTAPPAPSAADPPPVSSTASSSAALKRAMLVETTNEFLARRRDALQAKRVALQERALHAFLQLPPGSMAALILPSPIHRTSQELQLDSGGSPSMSRWAGGSGFLGLHHGSFASPNGPRSPPTPNGADPTITNVGATTIQMYVESLRLYNRYLLQREAAKKEKTAFENSMEGQLLQKRTELRELDRRLQFLRADALKVITACNALSEEKDRVRNETAMIRKERLEASGSRPRSRTNSALSLMGQAGGGNGGQGWTDNTTLTILARSSSSSIAMASQQNSAQKLGLEAYRNMTFSKQDLIRRRTKLEELKRRYEDQRLSLAAQLGSRDALHRIRST